MSQTPPNPPAIPPHELTPEFFHRKISEHEEDLVKVKKKVGIGIEEGQEEGEFVSRKYMREKILPELTSIKDGQKRTQVLVAGGAFAIIAVEFLIRIGVLHVG